MDTRLSRSMSSLWLSPTLLGLPARRSRPRRSPSPRDYYINGVRTTLIGVDSYPNPSRSPQRLILCGAGPRGENCFKETRSSSTEELSRSAVFRCIRGPGQGQRGRGERRAVSCEDINRTSTLSLPAWDRDARLAESCEDIHRTAAVAVHTRDLDSRLTESCEDVHRTAALGAYKKNRDSSLSESCEDVHRTAALAVHKKNRDSRLSESCEDVHRSAALSLPSLDRRALSKSYDDVHRTAALSLPTWDRDSRLSESGVSLSDSRTDLVSGAGLEEEEEDRVSQCSFGSSSAFHDMTMDSVSEADRLDTDGHGTWGQQRRLEGEARDRARGRTSGGRSERERWRSEMTTSSSGRSSPSEDRRGFYHSTPTKRGSPVLAVFPGDEEDLDFPGTLPRDHLHGGGLHEDDLSGGGLHGPLSPSSKSEEHFLRQGSQSHCSQEGVLGSGDASRDSLNHNTEKRVLFPSSVAHDCLHDSLDEHFENNLHFISSNPRDLLSGSVNNSKGSSPSSPNHSPTRSPHGAFLPYTSRLTDELSSQPSADGETGMESSQPSIQRAARGGDSEDTATEARRQTAELREAMRKRRQQFFSALHDCCQQEERSAEESVQSWLTTGHVQFTEDVVEPVPLTPRTSADQKEIGLDQPPEPVDMGLARVQDRLRALEQASQQQRCTTGSGDERPTTGSLLRVGDIEEESGRDAVLLTEENKGNTSLGVGATSTDLHTGPELSSFTRSLSLSPSEEGADVFPTQAALESVAAKPAYDALHLVDINREAGENPTSSSAGGPRVVSSEGERLERRLSFGDDEGGRCFQTALHGGLASSSVPAGRFDRTPRTAQHHHAGDRVHSTDSEYDTQNRPQDLPPTPVSPLARGAEDSTASTEMTADVLPDMLPNACPDNTLPTILTGKESPVLYHARLIQILPSGDEAEEASGDLSDREQISEGASFSLGMNEQPGHHPSLSAVTGGGDVFYSSADTDTSRRQRDCEDSSPLDTKAEQSHRSPSPMLTGNDGRQSSACPPHTGRQHSTEESNFAIDIESTESENVPAGVSYQRDAFKLDGSHHHLEDEDLFHVLQRDRHSPPAERHAEERTFDKETGTVSDVTAVDVQSGQRGTVSDITAAKTQSGRQGSVRDVTAFEAQSGQQGGVSDLTAVHAQSAQQGNVNDVIVSDAQSGQHGSVSDVTAVDAQSGQQTSVGDVTATETHGQYRGDTATAASTAAASRPEVKGGQLSPAGGGCLCDASSWRDEACQQLTAVSCLPTLEDQVEDVTSVHMPCLPSLEDQMEDLTSVHISCLSSLEDQVEDLTSVHMPCLPSLEDRVEDLTSVHMPCLPTLEDQVEDLTSVHMPCLPSLEDQVEDLTSVHVFTRQGHSGGYPRNQSVDFDACDGGGHGDNGDFDDVDAGDGILSSRTSLISCIEGKNSSHSTRSSDLSKRSSLPAFPATQPTAKEKPAPRKKATFTLAPSTAGKTRTSVSRSPWNKQWVHDKLLLFQRLLHDFETRTSQLKLLQGLVSFTTDNSSSSGGGGGGGGEERMTTYSEACDDLYSAFTREFLEVRQNQVCPLIEDHLPALRFQRYLRKRHSSRLRGQRRLRVRHSLHRVLELPRDSVFFSDTDIERSVSTPLLPHHLLSFSVPATTRLNSDVFADDADVSWSFSDSAYSTLSDVSSRQLSDVDSCTLTSLVDGYGGSESVDCSSDKQRALEDGYGGRESVDCSSDRRRHQGGMLGDGKVLLDETRVDEALLDRLRVCHSKAHLPASLPQRAAVPVQAGLPVAWRNL